MQVIVSLNDQARNCLIHFVTGDTSKFLEFSFFSAVRSLPAEKLREVEELACVTYHVKDVDFLD